MSTNYHYRARTRLPIKATHILGGQKKQQTTKQQQSFQLFIFFFLRMADIMWFLHSFFFSFFLDIKACWGVSILCWDWQQAFSFLQPRRCEESPIWIWLVGSWHYHIFLGCGLWLLYYCIILKYSNIRHLDFHFLNINHNINMLQEFLIF